MHSQSKLLRLLLAADQTRTCQRYLQRNNVEFVDPDHENCVVPGGCSPLYRAVQTIPDDFVTPSPTFEFILHLVQAIPKTKPAASNTVDAVRQGNAYS